MKLNVVNRGERPVHFAGRCSLLANKVFFPTGCATPTTSRSRSSCSSRRTRRTRRTHRRRGTRGCSPDSSSNPHDHFSKVRAVYCWFASDDRVWAGRWTRRSTCRTRCSRYDLTEIEGNLAIFCHIWGIFEEIFGSCCRGTSATCPPSTPATWTPSTSRESHDHCCLGIWIAFFQECQQ